MRQVAVVVLEGAKPLDVGIPAQVFTTRASMPYEVHVCGVRAGRVSGADGLAYLVEQGLEALDDAELIFLPGYRHPDTQEPPAELVDALLRAHARGARIAAISTGAFALAATGLLDGRRATTHWHYTSAFAAQFPAVRVNEGVLFVDEGSVLTSAGAASGLDLCLHILREDLGMSAANHAARRLVAAPYRSGGRPSSYRAACRRRTGSGSRPPASGLCAICRSRCRWRAWPSTRTSLRARSPGCSWARPDTRRCAG
ncbi:AraC family transcriptional regulator [Leucobacter soli]